MIYELKYYHLITKDNYVAASKLSIYSQILLVTCEIYTYVISELSYL